MEVIHAGVALAAGLSALAAAMVAEPVAERLAAYQRLLGTTLLALSVVHCLRQLRVLRDALGWNVGFGVAVWALFATSVALGAVTALPYRGRARLHAVLGIATVAASACYLAYRLGAVSLGSVVVYRAP